MDREKVVREMIFDTRQPMSTLFDTIDDLNDLSLAAEVPYSGPQLVLFAYDILLVTGAFESALLAWNEKQRRDKTWANFKVHFQNAHKSLKRVREKNNARNRIPSYKLHGRQGPQRNAGGPVNCFVRTRHCQRGSALRPSGQCNPRFHTEITN